MKRNKGVTLIALVVTIIVLIILATVSIQLVMGEGGLIDRANQSSTLSRAGSVEDEVNLWKTEKQLANYTKTVAKKEEEMLQGLKDKKLVKEEEINEQEKKITIGNKVIDYNIDEINKEAIIFLYNSGSGGEIVLPILDVETGYQVNWGDGSLDSNKKSHIYENENTEYIVTITGKVEQLASKGYLQEDGTIKNIYDDEAFQDKILKVLQWGETGLKYINLSQCSSLTEIAIPSEKSFEKIETFQSSFSSTSIQKIPEALFSNCPKVTSFEGTFYGSGIQSIPENLFTNCPNVENFKETFRSTKIQTIPEKLLKNNTKVKEFQGTFAYCNFTSIPLKLFDNCNEVTNFMGCFAENENITGKVPELWNRGTNNSANGYEGNPNGSSCFGNNTKAENYASIPSYWKNRYYS